MAKKKKKGGRRTTKAPLVRTGAKVLLVIDGGRRIFNALTDNWEGAEHIANTKKKPLEAGVYLVSGFDLTQKGDAEKNIGAQGALIGTAEVLAGPKGVDIAYKAIPAPEIKRLKVPGSSRKVL